MKNLILTLATAMAIFTSQTTSGDEVDSLITYDKETLTALAEQVDVKVRDLECLASVIYHESRGEPKKGKIAVGHVVLNRVNHQHYPDTICEVIFQPVQFTGLKRIKYDEASMDVAFKIMVGEYPNPIRKATHFHTTFVWPKWANKLKFVAQYGIHRFYQFA